MPPPSSATVDHQRAVGVAREPTSHPAGARRAAPRWPAPPTRSGRRRPRPRPAGRRSPAAVTATADRGAQQPLGLLAHGADQPEVVRARAAAGRAPAGGRRPARPRRRRGPAAAPGRPPRRGRAAARLRAVSMRSDHGAEARAQAVVQVAAQPAALLLARGDQLLPAVPAAARPASWPGPPRRPAGRRRPSSRSSRRDQLRADAVAGEQQAADLLAAVGDRQRCDRRGPAAVLGDAAAGRRRESTSTPTYGDRNASATAAATATSCSSAPSVRSSRSARPDTTRYGSSRSPSTHRRTSRQSGARSGT